MPPPVGPFVPAPLPEGYADQELGYGVHRSKRPKETPLQYRYWSMTHVTADSGIKFKEFVAWRHQYHMVKAGKLCNLTGKPEEMSPSSSGPAPGSAGTAVAPTDALLNALRTICNSSQQSFEEAARALLAQPQSGSVQTMGQILEASWHICQD